MVAREENERISILCQYSSSKYLQRTVSQSKVYFTYMTITLSCWIRGAKSFERSAGYEAFGFVASRGLGTDYVLPS